MKVYKQREILNQKKEATAANKATRDALMRSALVVVVTGIAPMHIAEVTRLSPDDAAGFKMLLVPSQPAAVAFVVVAAQSAPQTLIVVIAVVD